MSLALLLIPSAASAQLPCKGIDPLTAVRLAEIKSLVASTERDASLFRVGMGIDGVDSSAVVTVRDPVVCTSVTNAVHRAFGLTDPPTESLFVIRVGNRYVATYPRETEAWSWYYLDCSFVFLGATVV